MAITSPQIDESPFAAIREGHPCSCRSNQPIRTILSCRCKPSATALPCWSIMLQNSHKTCWYKMRETANGVLRTDSGPVLLLFSALGYASQSEMKQAAKTSRFKLTNGDNFEPFGVKFENYGGTHGRPFLLLAGSSGRDSKLLSVKLQTACISQFVIISRKQLKGVQALRTPRVSG